MSTEKEIKYETAFEELQEIIQEIEAGEIGVDDLSNKVIRAAFLIKLPKEKLFKTEKEVNQVLKDLGNPDIN